MRRKKSCKRIRSAVPVSYTHLDVYKRQVLVQFPEFGSNYLITLETVKNQDEMIVEVELSDLDVYKRQVEYNGRLYVYGTNDTQQLDSVGKYDKNTYQYIPFTGHAVHR